ncbi:hypothetical protein C2G38_2000882 [Gigaspora rosea]|uniref:Serine-threonine/tyrosine-protein kinase catalytic domain-containing protein n=1 Tax=Gigaspora rosea TaxID=44941 RepID=A0A397V8V5_9GLOM|nr:hypothetical protein C2G38_2000882 [Gigaspora rosea]
MWEISSGRTVYSEFSKHNEYADDQRLAIDICKGLRPTIIEGTAPGYAAFLNECWDENPKKRPSASKILKTIAEWKNGSLSEFVDHNNKMRKNVMIDNNSICSSKFVNCINKLNIADKHNSICSSKFIRNVNQLNITDKHSSVCSSNFIRNINELDIIDKYSSDNNIKIDMINDRKRKSKTSDENSSKRIHLT